MERARREAIKALLRWHRMNSHQQGIISAYSLENKLDKGLSKENRSG